MAQVTRKTYSFLIGAVFFIIVLVLGFTATLNILSFRESYENSLVNSYALAGRQTVSKIEYAIKYGKPLTNFYGMQDLLSEVKKFLPNIENAFVVMPDGEIAYDAQGRVSGNFDPGLQQELDMAAKDSGLEFVSLSQAGKHHLFLPIDTPGGEIAGHLDIVFDNRIIASKINGYNHQLILYLSLLSLAAIVLIAALYKLFQRKKNAGLNRKALIRIILCILAVAQIAFGMINYSMFKSGYLGITRETASLASRIVQNNVDSVLAKGVPYEKLYDLDDYLRTVAETIPQIDHIHVAHAGHLATDPAVENNPGSASAATEEYRLNLPLREDVNGNTGSVHVSLSQSMINGGIREILLDALTIIVVSFFFMVEVTLLVFYYVERRLSKEKKETDGGTKKDSLVRPLAFMIYSAVFMTAAFVPVVMKLIYKPLLGLPKDIALGLPISVEMLFGFIATIAAGHAIDNKGWKGSFMGGIAFFILGTLLSGCAQSPVLFILARGLTGAGFGLLVMSMRALVISFDPDTGIADMNAGATAGVTCGVVTGAMIADRVGFSLVFYISAALVIPAFILAVKEIAHSDAVNKAKKRVKGELKRFLLDRQAVGFLILILIPFSVCAMFLNYYFPLYANEAGMSSSNVGRAFMLNALCIVFLGPVLSKYLTARLGSRRTLILSVVVTVLSISVFALLGSLPAAFAALILLGVSDSFGISAQINVFMNSRGAAGLGKGKAIAYYSLISKLGQMLGPITFGAVALLGITKGIGLISVAVFAAMLLYVVIPRKSG